MNDGELQHDVGVVVPEGSCVVDSTQMGPADCPAVPEGPI